MLRCDVAECFYGCCITTITEVSVITAGLAVSSSKGVILHKDIRVATGEIPPPQIQICSTKDDDTNGANQPTDTTVSGI